MTPAVLHIAVSGHRQLGGELRLKQVAREAGKRIREAFPGRRYRVYSCLAEGADRMLADILMDTLPAELVVVLPLPDLEYQQDFASSESLMEFQRLKGLSSEVLFVEHETKRPQAYRDANQVLLQNCQVVVVLWDGLPPRGKGGTGELVEAVRLSGKALLWIHTNPQTPEEILTEENLTQKE